MSRSFNKVAMLGFCIANHKANSKYYKYKRKHHRTLLKRDLYNEISNIEDNISDCSNVCSILYNRQFRKTHRNTWDEPTDGRYKWFKPKRNKKRIVGDDWKIWNTGNIIKKEDLYNKYIRK